MPYTNGVEYTDLGTRDAASAARDQYKPPKAQQQPPAQPSQPTETAPVQDAASEARNAQIRDGAKSAYDNYLGNFSANVQATNKELVATGKNLMDSAYVFNEAWNAVQNGTVFQGSIQNQRAFVMNAALAFGDATAKAHGWQLVDEGVVGDVRHMTGFDKDSGTWNFVFKDKNGQYVTKSTTMDQVSSQLKNNGYYADTPAKDEGKSGSGKGGAPDNAGESGSASSKPRSEPGYGDISKQYNGFFEKTVDEEGNETGYTLSQQGEQFMRDELSVATGKERRWLISTLADKMAKDALDANAGAAAQGKDQTTYEQEYKRAVSALNEQYADPSAKSGEESAPQAPVDALEAFAESVNVEKSGMKGAYDAASARRKERDDKARSIAEQNRRSRSVYVNGKWVTQGDIDDGNVSVEPDGTWENGIKRDALNARKAENEARNASREAPLVTDDQRVKGLDDLLSGYGREDDAAYDRDNADYFAEDGSQLTQDEIAGVHEDANGNLVDRNGDPVRKEYWDDGTGGYDVKLSGDKVRVDMSEVRDTDARREEEIFDAVMQMSPETRRRLATETDEKGRLTYRASKVRQAIGAYVDKENIRDFSNAEGTMEGGAKRSDGSDRTAASVNKTYRDSKGGLVMEETFDGGRMTEQGREARINALLDAELGPGGFADTRSYADRNLAPEDDVELLRRRAQYRSRIANYDRPDSSRGEDYEVVDEDIGEAPRLTPEAQKYNSERRAERRSADLAQRQLRQAEENERRNAPSNVKSNIPELTQSQRDAEAAAAIQAMQDKGVGRVRSQKWKDEQALQRASQMTESEKQARAWANRDRSQPASVSEPAASEPENKPEPKPAPLPDDPAERRNAVKKDAHYSDVVLSENDDGTYQLTDKAIALLRENGLSPKNLSVEDVQRWIHEGDEYIINENPRAKDRAWLAETSKRDKVNAGVKQGRRQIIDRNLSARGEEAVAKLTDEYIDRLFGDEADYVKQKREQARKNIDRKRRSSGR